jgi:nucleotide-binding universal stress UspA family protein
LFLTKTLRHWISQKPKEAIMRILLALDQSKDSKVAIQLLQKLKWPAVSTLIILHVTTIDEEMTAGSSSRLHKKTLDDSGKPPLSVHSELHRLENQFASEALQVQSMVVNGVPGQEILSVIRKKKIDMAVLGSRGLSRISGLLLGSVSEWGCLMFGPHWTTNYTKSQIVVEP